MKRIACVIAWTALAGLPRLAAAQEAPVDGSAAPRIELGARLGMWMPMDDADDYSDASLGVRLHGVYWVVPMFAIGAAVDWVAVNEEEGVSDLTYYGIGITGLITTPAPSRVKPFGELSVGRYTLDSDDVDDSESDIGFRLGGGVSLEMAPNLALLADVAYSTVEFDFGLVSLDVAAFILEGGVAARF
jgi:hypothetical protein